MNLRHPQSRYSLLPRFLILVLVLCIPALASDWQKKVPESDRSAKNPLANDPSATTAGAKTYAEKCAKCHGENGEGKGHHPSLRTQKMQEATPGELNWVITHGTGLHGMPSFHKLSDTERWQLVSYIKSLQTSAGGVGTTPNSR